jgi:hypothetical protein
MEHNKSFILISVLLALAFLVSLSSCHGGVFGRPIGGAYCTDDSGCIDGGGNKTNGDQAGASGSAGIGNAGGSAGIGQPDTGNIRVRGSIVTVKGAQSASGSIRVTESALHMVPRVCNNSGICVTGGFVR